MYYAVQISGSRDTCDGHLFHHLRAEEFDRDIGLEIEAFPFQESIFPLSTG
jgi:hypothetical protein